MKDNIYCRKCGHSCEEFMDETIQRVHCPECGFIYYQNPFPCVSVLVVDDRNRILLGFRGADSIYPGKWCLPCGYIEYNETYVEAAIRETKEETGVTVIPKSIINVVSNQFGNGINSLVIVILAEPESRVVTPGDDIIKADWFDLYEELPDLAFDADVHIINKYLEAVKSGQQICAVALDGFCFKAD